jgi:hypothetical protein
VNRQFYTCINHLFTLSLIIVSNSITIEYLDSSIDIDSVLSASSSSSTVLLTGGNMSIRTVALALVGLLTIFDDHCYKFGTVAKCW